MFFDHYRRLDPAAVLQESKDLGGRLDGIWTASDAQVRKCIEKIFNERSKSIDWVVKSIKALEPHPDPRFEEEPINLFMPADTVDSSQGGHDEGETSQSARDPVDIAETSENARKRGRAGHGSQAPPVDFAAMADANAEKVRDLQKDLDESRAHAASLENMWSNLNVAYATARGDNAAGNAQLQDLRQQLTDLREQFEAKNEETMQLQDELAQAKEELGQAKEELDRANARPQVPPASNGGPQVHPEIADMMRDTATKINAAIAALTDNDRATFSLESENKKREAFLKAKSRVAVEDLESEELKRMNDPLADFRHQNECKASQDIATILAGMRRLATENEPSL